MGGGGGEGREGILFISIPGSVGWQVGEGKMAAGGDLGRPKKLA